MLFRLEYQGMALDCRCSGCLESGLPAGLRLLNLEENALSQWSDILLLGKLSRLVVYHLSLLCDRI